MVAIGSKGMLVYNEEQQTVTLYKKGIQSDLSNRDEGSKIIYQGNVQPLTMECQHFLTCLKERTKPLSDGKNGLEVIKILEQCSSLLQEEITTT